MNPLKASSLRRMVSPQLDRVLAAWRSAASVAMSPPRAPDADFMALAEVARVFEFTDAAQRLANAHPVPDSAGASRGGAAALQTIAEARLEGTLDLEKAADLVRSFDLDDGDILCVCIFATHAEDFSVLALYELAGCVVRDPALAVRLLHTAAGVANERGGEEWALELHELAVLRASEDDDPLFRSKTRNIAAGQAGKLQRWDRMADLAARAAEAAHESQDSRAVALAEFNKACALYELGQFDAALETYARLLRHVDELGNEQYALVVRRRAMVLAALLGRTSLLGVDEPPSRHPIDRVIHASMLARDGNTDEALEIITDAIRELEEGEYPEAFRACGYWSYAEVLRITGQCSEAAAYYRRARKFVDERGEAIDRARFYSELATCLLMDGSGRPLREAKEFAETALAAAREAGIDSLEEQIRPLLGRIQVMRQLREECTFDVGKFTNCFGIDKPAMRHFNARLDSSAAEQGGDPFARLIVLFERGKHALSAGHIEQAIEFLAEAHQIGKSVQEDETTLAVSRLYARALTQRGDLSTAADILDSTIQRARALSDREQELLASRLLGETLLQMGAFEEGEEALIAVASRSQQLNLPIPEALAIHSLGELANLRGDHQGAKDAFVRALHLLRPVRNQDELIPAIELDLARVYATQDRVADAVRVMEDVIARNRRRGDVEGELFARLSLIQLQISTGLVSAAATNMAELEVLSPAKLTGSTAVLMWFSRARIANLQGDWARARQLFLASFRELEPLRSTLSNARERRQFDQRYVEFSDIACVAAVEAGDAIAAVELQERSRARFLRSFTRDRAARPPEVDQLVWLEYHRTADRLAIAKRDWRRSLHAVEQEQQMRSARRAFEEASRSIPAIQPNSGMLDVADIDAICSQLPPGCATLFVSCPYDLVVVCVARESNGRLHTSCMTSDTFGAHRLRRLLFGDRSRIVSLVRKHGPDAWKELDPSQVGWVQAQTLPEQYLELRWKCIRLTLDALGVELWPHLIAQIPDGCTSVALIPGSGLNVLPLHAARLADGRIVSEIWPMSFAPSLQVVRRDEHDGPSHLGQVVNPTCDLPFAAIEAMHVADIHPGPTSTLDAANGTAQRVLELFRTSDVVHFSGHAFFDEEDPLRSGLLCASSDGAAEPLLLSRILESGSIRSRFVVLSACDSGKIDHFDPLGECVGLPASFLCLGAKAVLGTFFEVDDLASSLLVERFFHYWQVERASKAAALARAQTWLRSHVRVADVLRHLDLALSLDSDNVVLHELREAWQLEPSDELAFNHEAYWSPFFLSGLPS